MIQYDTKITFMLNNEGQLSLPDAGKTLLM